MLCCGPLFLLCADFVRSICCLLVTTGLWFITAQTPRHLGWHTSSAGMRENSYMQTWSLERFAPIIQIKRGGLVSFTDTTGRPSFGLVTKISKHKQISKKVMSITHICSFLHIYCHTNTYALSSTHAPVKHTCLLLHIYCHTNTYIV